MYFDLLIVSYVEEFVFYTGWVSATILIDDYLCYKEPKSPYNFFIISIFNELFEFKTSDERQHWRTASHSLDYNGINL